MRPLFPRSTVPLLAATLVVLAGCSTDRGGTVPTEPSPSALDAEAQAHSPRGRAVVANRGSGSISVIDARSEAIVGTYMLPAEADEPQPEPMYVVYVPQKQRVFVGDRANNRVAVFDARSFSTLGTVSAGAGVFHMWASPNGRQLWVNNDVDNTTTVINPRTLGVVATVPMPADLVAMGGKPHDVILGPHGRYAYVTLVGFGGSNDYVVQFDTRTFQEVGRAEVGKDPHVSVARQSEWLFVPCQNTDQVLVLDRRNLSLEADLEVPGAHGAGMTRNGRYFYTTNLPGGGPDALYTIDARTLSVIGDPVTSPYPVPHNIALSPNGKKMFVTHSGGSADKVTVYKMGGGDPTPVFVGEVTVGLNPFGITYVP